MASPIFIPKRTALGQHVLLELSQCPPGLLSDTGRLEEAMQEAAERMGATIVSSHFHKFSPYGASGVVIIQESHLTLHTWPEHGYAAVDIFTCGDIDLGTGANFLAKALQAGQWEWAAHDRGPS
ncbi:adenosylmethionine decarboxylase [Phaeodactylibacter luteus]|uniref:S-adenosylmethionine decarboxylase proenzyme n=1 Tax=Phaeodactylibacter luteus TaxID=1564516 RepID=A0A5C6S6Z2_9BACT|nr:adenosylmethionine decarboxylase [Phaeodactylibacter luteus]TXB70169.1 adenosylmethionine decarboxylase [Phaeodactylibacter luteus]